MTQTCSIYSTVVIPRAVVTIRQWSDQVKLRSSFCTAQGNLLKFKFLSRIKPMAESLEIAKLSISGYYNNLLKNNDKGIFTSWEEISSL